MTDARRDGGHVASETVAAGGGAGTVEVMARTKTRVSAVNKRRAELLARAERRRHDRMLMTRSTRIRGNHRRSADVEGV